MHSMKYDDATSPPSRPWWIDAPSVWGFTFGGDSTSTFALPDLRGRAPIHMGQGPGLSLYIIGQNGGVETTTLSVNQMPTHNHTINATSNPGSSSHPNAQFLASSGGAPSMIREREEMVWIPS